MSGSTVKNHISFKIGIRIQCNTENFVPIVVPGLSTSSSSSSHPSTSMTPSRQERQCSTSSSSSSSSPTTATSSDSETREREDRTESDTSPVLVSSFNVDDRTGQKVVCRLRSRKFWNPGVAARIQWKKWWMMEFLNTETHTPGPWPPNGSSRIRAKQKLLRKHKGACKSSWSQIGSLKSFTLNNLAKPVKIFPGIIVRQHHTDQTQMGLLREQCAE